MPTGIELGKVGITPQLCQPRKRDAPLDQGRKARPPGSMSCRLRRSNRVERSYSWTAPGGACTLVSRPSAGHGSSAAYMPLPPRDSHRIPAVNSEHHLKGLLPQRTHFEHREAKYVSLLIYLFHNLVARCLAEVSRLFVEDNLEIIAFRIKPNRYLKASSAAIFTTTHKNLSPTAVPK